VPILNSSWAAAPIDLTAPLFHDAWAGAMEKQMAIPGGFMWAKNDAQFAYIAFDITADTNNDPGTGDYFWLTFDKDRNGAITPNVDVNYSVYPGQPNKLGRQYYLGPGTWTGLLNEPSPSECRIAFEASPNSATPHRIWKMRIKLSEIGVSLLGWWLWPPRTRFGLRVASSTPSLIGNTPATFYTSFTDLHTLYFSRNGVAPSADLGPVMGSVGLIPTTKIDSGTGKATTAAGYYVTAQNDAFGGLLNLIGNHAQLQALKTAGATKYRIKKAEGAGGAFSNFNSAWFNYKWVASEYVLESFGPDASDFYPMPDPAVDYSIDDLLVQFDSTRLSTGIHRFQVEFFNAVGAVVSAPAPAQTLTLYIDNNVPQVKINDIWHGGAKVAACDIVEMTSPADGVTVNFDATDPEGNLHSYSVTASWGDGSSAGIESASYDAGVMGPSWSGVTNKTSALFVPVRTCAHAFNVTAWARTTNGYGRIGHNSASRFITIKK
jgi:hypothetical protein